MPQANYGVGFKCQLNWVYQYLILGARLSKRDVKIQQRVCQTSTKAGGK